MILLGSPDGILATAMVMLLGDCARGQRLAASSVV